MSVLAISLGHFIDGTVLAYPSSAIPSMQSDKNFEINRAEVDLVSKSDPVTFVISLLHVERKNRKT